MQYHPDQAMLEFGEEFAQEIGPENNFCGPFMVCGKCGQRMCFCRCLGEAKNDPDLN